MAYTAKLTGDICLTLIALRLKTQIHECQICALRCRPQRDVFQLLGWFQTFLLAQRTLRSSLIPKLDVRNLRPALPKKLDATASTDPVRSEAEQVRGTGLILNQLVSQASL